jgi:hypothetical protein
MLYACHACEPIREEYYSGTQGLYWNIGKHLRYASVIVAIAREVVLQFLEQPRVCLWIFFVIEMSSKCREI